MTNEEPIEAVVALALSGWHETEAEVRLAREVEDQQQWLEDQTRRFNMSLENLAHERDEARAEVGRLGDIAIAAVKLRDQARADNAALLAEMTYHQNQWDDGQRTCRWCEMPGVHAAHCVLFLDHPGAPLLARIERLRAVARSTARLYGHGDSCECASCKALDALQPGDLGGEA